MQNLDELFDKLAKSEFRQKFHLGDREHNYLQRKGMATILHHAANFIDQRLAAANPTNDGKQTPYRNHPVFIAQHATGTCCRSCLQKWHGISQGKVLDEIEKQYIISVIQRWLVSQTEDFC